MKIDKKILKDKKDFGEVIITAEGSEWLNFLQNAKTELAKTVTVPGFRKGKAPISKAMSKIDRTKIFDKAVQKLWVQAYDELNNSSNHIMPFDKPELDILKISDQICQIKLTFLLKPNVKLSKYKGLKDPSLVKKEVDISEKEIENEAKAILEHFGKKTQVDFVDYDNVVHFEITKINKNSKTLVKIFTEGKLENEKIIRILKKNYSLDNNEDYKPILIEMTNQLLSKKVNDVVTIKFKINDKIKIKELRNLEILFDIKILKILKYEIAEYNKEFFKKINIPKVNSQKELFDFIKKELQYKKKNDNINSFVNDLINFISKDSEFIISENLLSRNLKQKKEAFISSLQKQGLTIEDYKKYTSFDDKKIDLELKKELLKEVKKELILTKVLEIEKLKIDSKLLEEELYRIHRYKPEMLKDSKFQEHYSKELLRKTVINFLYNNNG